MRQSPAAEPRRYARVLLDVALAKGDAQALARELREAADALMSSLPLRKTLAHPALGAERRRKLVASVFASGSELLRGALQLLAERGHLELLPRVADAFAHAWNEHRQVIAADVVSAAPLDDQQAKALRAALEAQTGRRVELRARVDEALLGGLAVTLNGSTYDGSVRAQLQGLRRRLAQASAA